MTYINWQEIEMYSLVDLLVDGTIRPNNMKHQLSYYRLVGNAAMIAKLECAKKVVKLRELAAEVEAYKASMCTRF